MGRRRAIVPANGVWAEVPESLPQIFCISLPRLAERQENITRQFSAADIPFTFFWGVDGHDEMQLDTCQYVGGSGLQPGEIGTVQSHINLLSHIVREGIEEAIYFEDDAHLLTDRHGLLKAFQGIPRPYDFAVLHDYGKSSMRPHTDGHTDDYCRCLHTSYVTVAMAVTLEGAKKMLNRLVPFDNPVDCMLQNAGDDGFRLYQHWNGIATQSNSFPSTGRDQEGAGEIPPTLHQVWFGPERAPALTARYAGRDDYEFWDDDRFREEFPGSRANDTSLHPAQRADIARYEILFRFGGTYMDTDFELLRDTSPLLAPAGFLFGYQRTGDPANGFLACSRGHSLMGRLAREAPGRVAGGGIDQETGPGFLAACLRDHCGHQPWEYDVYIGGKKAGVRIADTGVIGYDPWVLYPYYMGEEWSPEEHPDAYAVHHWNGSWLPQEQPA